MVGQVEDEEVCSRRSLLFSGPLPIVDILLDVYKVQVVLDPREYDGW